MADFVEVFQPTFTKETMKPFEVKHQFSKLLSKKDCDEEEDDRMKEAWKFLEVNMRREAQKCAPHSRGFLCSSF